jgi:hypothetical protein
MSETLICHVEDRTYVEGAEENVRTCEEGMKTEKSA